MAVLMSNSSGNFTSAGTWSVVDNTSYLNSESNTTSLTTAFVSSQNFTPGAITIDGIAVKVASRSATPSGTISIRLFNASLASAVAGTTVTINVSDINATSGGWYFFKFAAPVLLLVATNYNVQASVSVNGQVALYRNATAANWSRCLRTTTTAAPAATDTLLINGEYTAAATNSSFTVTMNNTAGTVFGKIEISNLGKLAYGTAASTNYRLVVDSATELEVFAGGTLEIGTSGTPIPSTSTATLEFSITTNVDSGLNVNPAGTFTVYGATKTISTKLAADVSIGATSLTTSTSTSWLSGDSIAIASTTRTASQAERTTLTANAVGTTVSVSALIAAHSGTLPTRADIINLTRNVKIFGTSSTLQAYLLFQSTAIVDVNYAEIYFMGSATGNKRGINVNTTTGSCNISNCAIYDFSVASSIGILTSSTANNFTLSNNVFHLINNSAIEIGSTTGTNYTVSGCINIRNLNSNGYSFLDLGGTITNNTSTSSASVGMRFSDLSFTGTISGNTAYSNNSFGFNIQDATGAGTAKYQSMSTLTAWNNNNNGIRLNNIFNIELASLAVFGNATANIQNGSYCAKLLFSSANIEAGFPVVSPIGYSLASDQSDIIFQNCAFAGLTPHSTADVSIPSANIFATVQFRNCTLNSATKVLNTSTNLIHGSKLQFSRFQGIAANHITYKRFGTIQPDTVIYNRASPSSRLIPNNSTKKLRSTIKKIAVPSGQTATISVFVRKSVIGDGTAYNGNQPRLVLRFNSAVGITSDVVLATATNAANGAFELLTGTTPAITDDAVFEVEVDCDGTTGWVNVDDWSVA